MATKQVFLVASKDKPIDGLCARIENAGYALHHFCPTAGPIHSGLFTDDVVTLIEWISPNLAKKAEVLHELERAVPKSLPVFTASHEVLTSQLAGPLRYPDRVVGFSPLGFYRQTDTLTLAKTLIFREGLEATVNQLMVDWQLKPSWIQDTPGLIFPRTLATLVNEAAFALQEGVATATDIDIAMQLGTNYPQGPLAWADLIGVDVVLNILNTLWQTYRDARYRPCLLLQKMVAVGCCGQRTGQGFYAYPHQMDLHHVPSTSVEMTPHA